MKLRALTVWIDTAELDFSAFLDGDNEGHGLW